jgi:hypothetical protein
MGQFGVGHAAQRVENLATGAGRQVDDVGLPRPASAFARRDGTGRVDMPAMPEKARRSLDAA